MIKKKTNKKACPESRRRVMVALSGGVDSSVAAALLKKAGLNISGAYMRLNDFSQESEKRAKKVAKILDIPFYVFDFRKEFKKRVVDYFLEGYKKGITPNPCVNCNKEIKFGLFLEKALEMGAEFVATGHYARIAPVNGLKIKVERKSEESANLNLKSCNLQLLSGKDKEKDQSYFLWKLNQNQLKRILFPVGNYTRAQVEALAKELESPFFEVKKSVEICFIPKSTEEFLKKYLKMKPGEIVDMQGKKIGRHKGLPPYTIGQRKGIGLPGGSTFAEATADKKASVGKPYYVVEKDLKRNNLVVTQNEKDLLKKELTVKKVSWISGKKPRFPLKVSVKIRYRNKSMPATIHKINDTDYKILFTKFQRAITPGQSAVFYHRQELLGGGIIC